jgi:hypothetical protein
MATDMCVWRSAWNVDMAGLLPLATTLPTLRTRAREIRRTTMTIQRQGPGQSCA